MTVVFLQFNWFTTWGELLHIPRTGADYIFPRQDDSARGRNNAGEIELSGINNGLATINKQMSLPILGNENV